MAQPTRLSDAALFTDDAAFDLERKRVFHRAWLAACAEHEIARPGDYRTFEEVGPSVLLVRGHDGVVRAFRNSCRHRGACVAEGSGRARSLTCRIHNWTYELDGSLRPPPAVDGFEDFDPADKGLVPVRCETWIGLVWICLDDDAPELRETLHGVDEELEPYNLEQMRPLHQRVDTLQSNWKAILDISQETYHVPAVHPRSIGPHLFSQPQVEGYGDHHRMVADVAPYRWRSWLDRRCARGGPYTDEQLRCLHKYVVFPNLMLNVLPYHLTIFQTWPIDAHRCRFHYSFHLRRGVRPLEAVRGVGTWMASRLILREDLAVLDLITKGAAAYPEGDFVFHENEAAPAYFMGTLRRWLDR
ncbi:MAG: aromatic ring-hydroxylating dioxygenase subunit alpha [Proteobacteria bacterium]|nr:aromatic ring-hydroxylating dioxygenase subunit alpha [Pseudomonadota bacterium]